MDNNLIFFAFLSLFTFVSWLPNTYFSIEAWMANTKSYSGIRRMFVAVMLQIGLLRIFIGLVDRIWDGIPVIDLLYNVTTPVISAMLLSGGVVTGLTWWLDRQSLKRA